jgi:hypothetical protein
MLRFFFWTLLIINALLLSAKIAFDYGYLDSFITKNSEPYRMKAQLNTQKLKVMTIDEAMNIVEKNNKKETLISCLEVGQFTQAESASLETILKSLNLGERQRVIDVSDAPKTMVYLPALGSKDAVDKKSAQLRKLGITDFHLVEDRNLPVWSISLGVFSTLEAAKTHQANLSKKGIKETRTAPKASSTSKFAYRFKDIAIAEKNVIDTLQTKIANYQEKECAAK